MPGQPVKRSLVYSPAGTPPPAQDKSRGKRHKKTQEETEEMIREERGMEETSAAVSTGASKGDVDGGVDIDVGDIHTTILTRINETLAHEGMSQEEGDSNKLFLQQVLPAIVTSVAVAVGEVMGKVLKAFTETAAKKVAEQTSGVMQQMQRNILLLKYENDRLEQYTRRETVRIVGLRGGERENDDLEQRVITLFKDAGTEVVPDDIAVVHWTGSARQTNRHVLVRFVSRKKKTEVMKKKKNLKGKAGYERVYLNDDLTPLRSKMLGYIKATGKFNVWSVEGRLFCVRKQPPGVQQSTERPTVIDSPDDLFKLGFDSVDFARLGLGNLFVSED